MLDPIKAGFGEYMVNFFNQIQPTTKALQEYVNRDVTKAIAWCPSRMFDMATEMLAAWQRNDTDGTTTHPYKLPVIIVAMGRSSFPTGRDYTRQLGEEFFITLPNDPKNRVFKMRSASEDVMVSVNIFAQEINTAWDLAKQFGLWLDTDGNHSFDAKFKFAGLDADFPVTLDSPEVPFEDTSDPEVKNVVIYTAKLSLHAQIPFFKAPSAGEPNDGQGVVGTDDPPGYLRP